VRARYSRMVAYLFWTRRSNLSVAGGISFGGLLSVRSAVKLVFPGCTDILVFVLGYLLILSLSHETGLQNYCWDSPLFKL
jgi:hypothetical protein